MDVDQPIPSLPSLPSLPSIGLQSNEPVEPTTQQTVTTNPFVELVNDFEKSLKSWVSIYNVEIPENRTNNEFGKKVALNQIELNKKIIEQQTEDIYEKARNLERLFLNSRLEILKKEPDQFAKEEISCLKAELARKDELLNDTKRKINGYEQTLKSVGSSLDHQIKSRTEMSTHSYIPTDNVNTGNFVGTPTGPQGPLASTIPHYQ